MSPVRRIFTALLVASLGGFSAVAATACGEDDVLSDNAEEVKVSLTERDLSPERVEVTAGEIEFVVDNDGERLHAFAVETPDGTKTTKDIDPGETERVTVDLSDGKYQMYDPRGGYRERGVSGTVVVGSDETGTVTERTVTERTEEDTVEAPEVEEPAETETKTQTETQPPPPPPAPTVTKEVPVEPPPTTMPTTPTSP